MDSSYRLLEEVKLMSGFDDDNRRRDGVWDRPARSVMLVGFGVALGLGLAILALKLV